ncbi:MAG: Gfo/Idh/MocA family oxidoreductase [Rhodopirellula sp.]|nr:Gfo/Idh/MocA family oxidoreductase [Rhodopirellula sp.]
MAGTPQGSSDCSRRRFLQQGGSALAGLALASQYVVADESSRKKVRIGIVGGRFGLSFHWFRLHPDCIVEAVSDLRPERRERLMKTYQCQKAYDSLEELVRDPKIDAVGIYTDGPLHVDHVELAMKHGKHVLSAVPACWGSVEQAERLLAAVRQSGLKYMLNETSYYQQATISARKFQQEGKFGDIFYCESQYDHPGLEALYFEDGKRTWRHGMAPMHYPTHCTAHLVSVTGERLVEVKCHGWGDDDPICKDNVYKNPFWNEMAMFSTDRDNAFRVRVAWRGAMRGGETARWYGNRMSFHMHDPNGLGPIIVRSGKQTEKDDAGFVRDLPGFEQYQQPNWWATDMLPEPLRQNSGHEGSHTFLVHEFVSTLAEDRQPAIDVYEALAYTVPGIVAHESALRGGETLKIPQYTRPAVNNK